MFIDYKYVNAYYYYGRGQLHFSYDYILGWIPFVWKKKTSQGKSFKFHNACNYNIKISAVAMGNIFFHASNFRAGT